MNRYDDGTTWLSREEFAGWLRQRLERCAPAAAVRFGDGEARLLTADQDDAEAIDGAIVRLEVQAGLSPSPAEVLEIKALLALAFDEADVLGIGVERSLVAHKQWMDRLADLYAERLAEGRRPAALAHCLLSHQVLDDLPELLAGRRVSAVSCRDLKPILESEWGLADVAVYQVPSQYASRDVDGAYEAALHHTPIWPDACERVRAELTVRERGEVFLVGAGLFGKDLCIRIRDQGGIALDMGSALDRLAAKITRGPRRRVLGFHASGVPAEEIPDRMRRFYGTSGHDEEIQEAIAEALDAAHDYVSAWRARQLSRTYATVRFDAVQVEISEGASTRNHTLHLAVGITPGGNRDPLGVWREDGESTQPPPAALDDLRRRGVRDLSVSTEPIDAGKAVRRAIDTHGAFADEQAAATLVYLSLCRSEAKRPLPSRSRC